MGIRDRIKRKGRGSGQGSEGEGDTNTAPEQIADDGGKVSVRATVRTKVRIRATTWIRGRLLTRGGFWLKQHKDATG